MSLFLPIIEHTFDTEVDIVDNNLTKELRASLLDRVEVLNKVKTLLLLPGLSMITINQVAAYFEVPVEAIQGCYRRHREELTSNGAVTLTPTMLRERLIGCDVQLAGSATSQLVCINGEEYFEIPNRGCKFFTPRAVLNIAMLLKDSSVAQEIRNQLLNIVEETQPLERVVQIDNEQEILLELGQAIASGDFQAVLKAQAQYNAFKNKHLEEAREQISTLTAQKESVDTMNAMLAERSLVWEPRRALNALIREIAATAFDHKYYAAWDRFYRELKYQTGIHIATRSSRSGKPVLDTVKDEEWPKLLKVAASLCYDYAIDVVHATNEETVRAYNLDTVETQFGIRKNKGVVVTSFIEGTSALY